MKSFVVFLREAKDPTEVTRLKSLIFYIDQALKADNKEAYKELMQAVNNFSETLTFNKHMQAAAKHMDFKPFK